MSAWGAAAAGAVAGELERVAMETLELSPLRPYASGEQKRWPLGKRRQPAAPEASSTMALPKASRATLPCPLALSRERVAAKELLLAETQARARMHEKNRSLRVAASLESYIETLQVQLMEARAEHQKREVRGLNLQSPCPAPLPADCPAPRPEPSPAPRVTVNGYDVLCLCPAPTPALSGEERPPTLTEEDHPAFEPDWDPSDAELASQPDASDVEMDSPPLA